MNHRSAAASQGHYTRRLNAGTVTHYTPVLCIVTLRTGDELPGYVWVDGLRYTPSELRTFLQGLAAHEPSRLETLTLSVGPTRADVQTFPIASIRRVRVQE